MLIQPRLTVYQCTWDNCAFVLLLNHLLFDYQYILTTRFNTATFIMFMIYRDERGQCHQFHNSSAIPRRERHEFKHSSHDWGFKSTIRKHRIHPWFFSVMRIAHLFNFCVVLFVCLRCVLNDFCVTGFSILTCPFGFLY